MTRFSLYCIAIRQIFANTHPPRINIMTPFEYVTVAIAAAAIVTRIVMFVRTPSAKGTRTKAAA